MRIENNRAGINKILIVEPKNKVTSMNYSNNLLIIENQDYTGQL